MTTARTHSEIEQVASEIRSLGQQALAIATDVSDEEGVATSTLRGARELLAQGLSLRAVARPLNVRPTAVSRAVAA